MDREQLVDFVHGHGVGVVATRTADGAPEAALVGLAITDRAELVFDTAADSRKCRNLRGDPRVAVVVGGWDEEVTVQCEGRAEVVTGTERERCLRHYVEQYPDGRERAEDPEIVLVRVQLDRGRLSDYRPDSFGAEDITFGR